ncbi:hypothetical protein BH23ACT12_BH23ACT12_19650 [soil metagenome]
MEDNERSTAPAPDEVNEAPVSSPGDSAAPSAAGLADETVAADRSEAMTDDPAAPAAAGAPDRSTSSTATVSRPPSGKAGLKGRGGTAGIFAGVAIIAPVLIRELALGSEPFLLLPVSMIALAVALSGFRVAQGGRDGKLGRIGLIVAVGGALILTIMFAIMAYNDLVLNTRLQSGTWLLQLGFFALLAGILIFGAATLVAGVLTRGPTLLMMVSLVGGLLLDMIGAFPGLRFRWGPDIVLGQGMHYGLKIFGLSLIWLGYSILKDTKAKAAVVSEA